MNSFYDQYQQNLDTVSQFIQYKLSGSLDEKGMKAVFDHKGRKWTILNSSEESRLAIQQILYAPDLFRMYEMYSVQPVVDLKTDAQGNLRISLKGFARSDGMQSALFSMARGVK
ncbi:MAG: hypothetical protein K0S07_39 [Chlamydiales bacterium]|nr:hypothetical protein [Chlamydiales bacterium]